MSRKGPADYRFVRVLLDTDGHSCWEWPAEGTNGYGYFSNGEKNVLAHRFAYEMFVGPIPNGLNVLHSCDNRRCVNPKHLRAGTQKENMADRADRGRHVAPSGERHGNAKLTTAQVTEIRERYRTEPWGVRRTRSNARLLAAEFDINVSTVFSIATGRSRKHG